MKWGGLVKRSTAFCLERTCVLGMGPRLFKSIHSIGRSNDAGHVFLESIYSYFCIIHNHLKSQDDLVVETISLTFGGLARMQIGRTLTPVAPGSMRHAMDTTVVR